LVAATGATPRSTEQSGGVKILGSIDDQTLLIGVGTEQQAHALAFNVLTGEFSTPVIPTTTGGD
jgi:hypothetical protein